MSQGQSEKIASISKQQRLQLSSTDEYSSKRRINHYLKTAILILAVLILMLQLYSFSTYTKLPKKVSEKVNQVHQQAIAVQSHSQIPPQSKYNRPKECRPLSSILPTIPITFVWLGSRLPPKYVHQLNYTKFPYVLLTEDDWNIIGQQWKKYRSLRSVQKADILRLLYVYKYGGIYADLDVYCDLSLLFLDLPKQKGCYFAGHAGQPVFPDGINNSFIYCTDKGDPHIKQALDSIRKNVEERERTGRDKGILQTTGPIELRRHSTFHALPRYYDYCYHGGDANWKKK